MSAVDELYAEIEKATLKRRVQMLGIEARHFVDRRRTAGALKRELGRGAKVSVKRRHPGRITNSRAHGTFDATANGIRFTGNIGRRSLQIQTAYSAKPHDANGNRPKSSSGAGARGMSALARVAGRRKKLLEGSNNGMSASAIRAGRYLAAQGHKVHIARDSKRMGGRNDGTRFSPSRRAIFSVQPKGSSIAPHPKAYRALNYKRVRKSADPLDALYAVIAKARISLNV